MRLIIFIFFFTCCAYAHAQKSPFSISLGYGSTRISGHNYLIFNARPIKNWNIYAGTKYFFNTPNQPKRIEYNVGNRVSRPTLGIRELYANSFSEHWGIKAGVERNFNVKVHGVHLFAFYDFQFSEAIVGKKIYQDITDEYEKLYNTQLTKPIHGLLMYKHGPARAIEHYIGVGLKGTITNRLSYKYHIGLGTSKFSTELFDNTPGHFRVQYGPLEYKAVNASFGIALQYGLAKTNRDNLKAKFSEFDWQRHRISTSYINTYGNAHIDLLYARNLKKQWAVYGGLKYLLNGQLREIDFSRPFYKNINATGSSHIGIKLGAERSFKIGNNEATRFFGFADIQASSARLRYVRHSIYKEDDPTFGTILYDYDFFKPLESHTPTNIVEGTVGLGVRTMISTNTSLRVLGGIGPIYFSTSEIGLNGTKLINNNQLVFGTSFGIGIEYHLSKK